MESHSCSNHDSHARKELKELFASEDGNPLANAFGQKSVAHPFVGGMSPVPPNSIESIWAELVKIPRSGKSTAYIHVPFCENHCLFCGFYQNAWHEQHGTRYATAVIENLRREADLPYQSQSPVHAVYFGGGTPTVLSPKDLARLVQATRQYLPLAADCEITVEGRIYSFSTEKVKAVFDAGANRVSIGVQSFHEQLRQSMGRKVPRKNVIQFLEQLVAYDRATIVIDLIYGLPDQTMAMWEDDVRTAIEIGVDGIDLYSLKLIQGTPLQAAIAKGKFKPPSLSELGAFYLRGAQLLNEARWETLSTTHWRRTTRERNLYNLEIKSGADCLAYGSGAGGFLGGYSYRIDANVVNYQNSIEAGNNPVAGLIKQSEYRTLFNLIKADMEQGRLNLTRLSQELKEHYSLDVDKATGLLFEQWQRAGLLTASGGWIDLTTAGRFWQVTMTQNLIEWLRQNIIDQSTKTASVMIG